MVEGKTDGTKYRVKLFQRNPVKDLNWDGRSPFKLTMPKLHWTDSKPRT